MISTFLRVYPCVTAYKVGGFDGAIMRILTPKPASPIIFQAGSGVIVAEGVAASVSFRPGERIGVKLSVAPETVVAIFAGEIPQEDITHPARDRINPTERPGFPKGFISSSPAIRKIFLRNDENSSAHGCRKKRNRSRLAEDQIGDGKAPQTIVEGRP
jgi:hypothetical protein